MLNECELPISCKFHTKRREEGEVSEKRLGKGGHEKNLIKIHVFTREMKRSGARKLINPSTYPGYSKDFIKH